MHNFVFILIVFLAVLLTNLYPIYQAIQTKGYIFYTNAFDEPSYLQYDFSIASQDLSRLPQRIVTLAHDLGLSGGWINLLLDIITLILSLVLVRTILRQLGYSSKQANLFSFIINVLPLLFSSINPVVNYLFNLNLASPSIFWITLPQAYYLPIYRSPEPQVSIIILLLSVYVSLRYKSFIPAYLCIPFLYSFIKIPFLFIILAIHLKHRFNRLSKYLAILISFAVTSSILGVYLNLFTDEVSKQIMVNSHYPLISITSVICLLLYLAFYKSIDDRVRYAALVISFSPLVASNHQVISGWMSAPNSFEQNFGVYCISIILSLILINKIIYSLIALAVAVLMLCISANQVFDTNYQVNQKLPLSNKLLVALKNDSPNVAINDVNLASLASMLFPRQSSTLFAWQSTYSALAEESFGKYLCAKAQILKREELADKFQDVFSQLDRAYEYEHEDFILLHLGRKKDFNVKRDPKVLPTTCSSRRLQYFEIDRDGTNIPLASAPTLRVKDFSIDWEKTNSIKNMVVDKAAASVQITTNTSTYDFQLVSRPVEVEKQSKYLMQLNLKVATGGAGVHVLGRDRQTVIASHYWCEPNTNFSKKQFLFETADNPEISVVVSNCGHPQPESSTFWIKDLEMWGTQSDGKGK